MMREVATSEVRVLLVTSPPIGNVTGGVRVLLVTSPAVIGLEAGACDVFDL